MNSSELSGGRKIIQMAVVPLFAVCCAINTRAAACTASEPRANFVSSPSRGVRGNPYDLTVQDTNCELSNFKLLPPLGSGITAVIDPKSNSNILIFHLTIEKEAPAGSVLLSLLDPNSKPIITIPFEVAAVTPGAIPPGLTPQVDMTWFVVDPDVTEDNFGHRVRNKFYCIQLTIGNNSGFDLQIASVGFTLNREDGNGTGNTDYSMVRGSLDWGQKTNLWSLANLTLVAAGPVLTATLPLVSNATKRAQRAELINIFNPLATAFAFIFPFQGGFSAQFKHLDDSTLRQGFVIHNNQPAPPVFVFVAKKNVPGLTTKSGGCLKSSFLLVRPVAHQEDDPACVKGKLGKLVLVGESIQYLNRVTVVEPSQPKGAPVVALSATNLPLSSTAVGTKSLPQTVTLTNIGNAPLTINKIEPTTIDANGFAQATTCGASPVTSTAALAPNGTCTISVTFTPTAKAAVTGTLSITDDAAGSPQKVSLSGTVTP